MAVEENAGIKGIRRAIGDELRRARERKKASLNDVAKRTKINPVYLQSIEEGEFSFLPEPYVRAFIRAYAQEVGLEPSTMLKPLDRVRERPHEAKPVVPVQDASKGPSLSAIFARLKGLFSKPKGLSLWLIIGGVVLVGLVAVYVRNYEGLFGTRTVPVRSAAQRVTADAHSPTELLLQIEWLAETWAQVAADDSTLTEGLYKAGERKSWRAHGHFQVKAADGAAVVMFLNGAPLGRLGDKGKETSVRIERQGIVSRVTRRGPDRTPVEFEQLTVEQYRGGLPRRQP